MDAKLFGKNVLLLRKKRGLSQEQLANFTGISRNYISMIEREEAENVSDEIIRKLALGLDVSMKQLTGEAGGSYPVMIPPALREFGINEGISYKIIERLLQIPFRGKEPITPDDWKTLYEAIKSYLVED